MTGRESIPWADRVRAALASCLGLGRAPIAPGTVGTAGAAVLVLALWPLAGHAGFHFGAAIATMIALSLIVGIALGRWAERYWGRKDPSAFVLDEAAGYWVALARLDAGFPDRPWLVLGTAFLAFRLFDVLKPPPVRWFERLPGGAGIMLDDVVAGVYSWVVVYLVEHHLWPG